MSSKSSSLAERAEELRRRVSASDRRATEGHEAQGLTTRQAQLSRLAEETRELVGRRDVLRAGGVHFALNASPVRELSTALAGARESFAADPASITRPNAVDSAVIGQVLQAVRTTLLAAWERHVNAPTDDRLAETLEAIPRFESAALQLRGVYAELRRVAARLPQNEAGVRVPDQLRTRADSLMRSLKLDDRVLALLGRAQREGIPLSELLASGGLLDELRKLHILDCLRVVI